MEEKYDESITNMIYISRMKYIFLLLFAIHFTSAVSQTEKNKNARELTVTVGEFGEFAAGLPEYHRVMKPLNKYIDAKAISQGIGRDELNKAIEKVTKAYYTVAIDKHEVGMTLCRMLVSAGRYDEALNVIEKKIEKEKSWYTDSMINNRAWTRYSYDAGAEIEKWVVRALIYDISGKNDADRAYDDAIAFVEQKIEAKDVKKRMNEQKFSYLNRKRNDLMHATAMTVRDDRNTKLNSDDRHDLDRERILESHTKLIKDFARQNKITNATTIQNLNEIDKLHEKMLFGECNMNDTLKLYGIKSMLIGLRDGHETETEYLKNFADRKDIKEKLKSYLKKIERKIGQSGIPDHNSIIRSIIGYAPVTDETKSAAENKSERKTFYKNRKWVEKTYPLRWLRE